MAHPDLDALYDYTLNNALMYLRNAGKFQPFGATIRANGRTIADVVPMQSPDSQAMLEGLFEGLKMAAAAGDLDACAVCFDVQIDQHQTNGTEDWVLKTDAICIHLEHANGECLRAYLPYANDGASIEGIYKIRQGDAQSHFQDRAVFVSAIHRIPGMDNPTLRLTSDE